MRAAETLVAAITLLSLASAANAGQRIRFDVPAGRLGDAAAVLGRQAGISIGVRDPALAGRPVSAVRGTLSAEKALRRMLVGTNGRAVLLAPRTYLIVAQPLHRPRPVPRLRPAPTSVPSPRRPEPPLAPQEIAEEIVVTGSKRQLRLSDYPGAATLIDGRDPAFEGLSGTDALVERLPAVTSTHLGPGRNKLFLRGIADSSFNGPTQATVGQYLGETRLTYNAPDPDLRLHDIERVEVLPGPQGTLYGAGAVGGIIRIMPNAPDLLGVSGSLSSGVSATAHGGVGGDVAGMFNLPILGETAALRLSAYAESEAGYIDDAEGRDDDLNRTHIRGARAALRLRPGGEWTVDLGATGQRIEGEDAQFADRDGPPLTRRSRVKQDFRSGYALASLVVSRDWGDLRLVSATGMVRQTLEEHYDSSHKDGPPTQFEQRTEVTMLSADTRLSREAAQGRGWLIGASLIRNRSDQARALGPPDALQPTTGVRNAIDEATLYGEASVGITDAITVTGGARLAYSRLSGTALDVPQQIAVLLRKVQANRAETSFLPSLSIVAKPGSGWMLFLRYQEGFRPGGLSVTGSLVQRFRNDKVRSVEGGLRFVGAPFDLAASIAHTRWSDIQADIIDLGGMPTTANIGDGRIWTLDLRAGWRPLPGLSLEGGAIFHDSRVTNPLVTIVIAPSAALPNVARANARLGAEYRTALSPSLDLRLAAGLRYVGNSRLGIGPILGEPQGDWLDTRLSARLESGAHAWSIQISNLIDEAGNRFAFGSPFTLVESRQVTPLRPRTIRLGWETSF